MCASSPGHLVSWTSHVSDISCYCGFVILRARRLPAEELALSLPKDLCNFAGGTGGADKLHRSFAAQNAAQDDNAFFGLAT